MAKPGGGFFLSDPHFGGGATRVRLVEVTWGRLVDVYDVDVLGRPNPVPVLRDVLIGESALSDGSRYELETSPITHESRLIIRRAHDAPSEDGQETFAEILALATEHLGAVLPKADDGTASLPLSFVARNAALMLRFDDLLDDGPEARTTLVDTARLLTGYPPKEPVTVRVLFDPSHGGSANGAFHSTRVLLDFSVSELDALSLSYSAPINPAGLPASSPVSQQANGSVRLPTRLDDASGGFVRLTNLEGHELAREGPFDEESGDLVRAFRVGNSTDPNGGFLLDLSSPSVVSFWEVAVEEAVANPLGPEGYGFVLGLRFRTPCRAQPRVGDLLQLGSELYEVREPGRDPDALGRVDALVVQRLNAEPLADPGALLGLGRYLTPYITNSSLHPTCWINFVPPPREPPLQGIESDASVSVRFSEPMDPASFRAFDTLRVLHRLQPGEEARADDFVIGAVRAAPSLQEFSFVPRLPFDNRGTLEYRFELDAGPEGVRDLSGSTLESAFTIADFLLARDQPPQSNSGFALRFASADELDPPGFTDIHGQVTYDSNGGILRPRPATFASYSADRTIPVPSIMLPYGFGVQTPLSSMGSKLQTLWRYCDFGFRVRDEAFHNLDVIGMSWSPLGGALIADFFPLFELRLAHSRWVPDETGGAGGAPRYTDSGLLANPEPFVLNLLEDPRGPQVVVHPRTLGYRVRPSDLTVSGPGTPFMPFPWNRSGGPLTTFTWRDTAVLAKGGRNSPGVPLDIEVGPPLNFDTGVGEYAPSNEVPSVGLPLLLEVRCFPSSLALGFNSLDILLPYPGFPTPNFRAFSTGGFDQFGFPNFVDPDLEAVPHGGFNPRSSPPGRPTPLTADNSFYVAQIDTVVRVSRAVSIWIQSGAFSPRYVEPVIEPRSQVGATAIEFEFRGADGFSGDFGSDPFDAASLSPYGDFRSGTVQFHGDGTWSSDLRTIDGAPYVQVRFTFLNDLQGALSPELDSFGLAFEVR